MHWTDGERLTWSRDITHLRKDRLRVAGAKSLFCAAPDCLWHSWRAQARLGVCSYLKALEMWWPGIPRSCASCHSLGRKVGSCCTWRDQLKIQQTSSYNAPPPPTPPGVGACLLPHQDRPTLQWCSCCLNRWHVIQQSALSSIQGWMLWGKRQHHRQMWLISNHLPASLLRIAKTFYILM